MDAATHSNLKRLSSQDRFLKSLPSDIRTVLDLGAGAGNHSAWFRDQGLTVTACDYWDSAFQYHGEIEFVKGTEQLEPGRKFDAVFASHILEHCPDTLSALQSWKQFVRDDGYLIIIVPPYAPCAVDDHWNIGWNAPQLAVTLVSVGLDCRESIFTEDHVNVCGWGKLNPAVDVRGFSLRKVIPWLPSGLTKFLREDEYGQPQLFSMASFMHPDGSSIAKSSRFTVPLPGFADTVALECRLHDWVSVTMHGTPRKLPDPLRVAMLCEGSGTTDLHITLGSGYNGKDFVNEASFGSYLTAGFHVFEIIETEFQRTKGEIDFGAIDHIAVGSPNGGLHIRIWLMEADGTPWRFGTQRSYFGRPIDEIKAEQARAARSKKSG